MSKLTLSIDKTVREAAKRYARKTNTTVSQLVEDYLIRLMSHQSESHPDAVSELVGFARTKTPPDDDKRARLEYLREKYLEP